MKPFGEVISVETNKVISELLKEAYLDKLSKEELVELRLKLRSLLEDFRYNLARELKDRI